MSTYFIKQKRGFLTKYEVVEVRTVGLCVFVAMDGGNFWGRKKVR